MYILTVDTDFSSAHQLRGYKGKCENLHGHNWIVTLSVSGKELNDAGLLIDFHDLKAIVNTACERYDHKNLNEIPPFDTINPSSENIARVMADIIQDELKKIDRALFIHSITIGESASSKCTFTPD